MNVLVSLHPGYGLGDNVAVSAVLRHIVAHRPDWRVDYRAEDSKHHIGHGIVTSTFAHGEHHPTDHYDAEVQIALFDRWHGFTDRPNTRVTEALHNIGIPWNAGLARYQIHVSQESVIAAETLLRQTPPSRHMARQNRFLRFVAVHYQGDSDRGNKDLLPCQAHDICAVVETMGRMPLVLDWRNRSILTNRCRHISVPQEWGGDAEMICALIAECEAFVGIDSGPGKCASATNTPSLIVWTGHHPLRYHDPAPNTTHLLPLNHRDLLPSGTDLDWFEENYNFRLYYNDPVPQVERWLREILQ